MALEGSQPDPLDPPPPQDHRPPHRHFAHEDQEHEATAEKVENFNELEEDVWEGVGGERDTAVLEACMDEVKDPENSEDKEELGTEDLIVE